MVIDITAANYEEEVKNSDIPVLLDFYAEWCEPCARMAPLLEEVSEKFDGRVKFGRVDTSAEKELRIKFCVAVLPTLTFVKDGMMIDLLDAAAPATEIERRLELALSGSLDESLARKIR